LYWRTIAGVTIVVLATAIATILSVIEYGWQSLVSFDAFAIFFATIGALVLGIAGLRAELQSSVDAKRAAKQSQEQLRMVSLPGRIDLLRDNLKASNAIIEEITAELHLQVAALDRIRGEAEQNRALAALHQDEADAIKKLVEATIHGAQNLTVKTSKRQQWLFFLSGLLLGIPLSVFANFVYDLVK
jgi:hypothetical protein